jgi:hypothetical protein
MSAPGTVTARELQRAAMGADVCRFEAGPPEGQK